MALFRNCAVLGSPPRMRGKAALCALDRAAVGITPAYAGKRTLVGECPKPLWDHPRVCGEKNNTAKTYSNMEGSPPRMRGKGQAGRKVVVELGITPAYAGKSTPDRLFLYHLGDHPRVCGEKPGGRLRELVYPGSPPRVRGKAKRHARLLLPAGITPACAGKRARATAPMTPGWDHPRVCGEKRTTAGRSSGACAATSNAIGMVTSALYRSAMSYTKEHSCPTCTNPSPGAHPSATMTAWASPYRQACTVGHTGAGAEQQHRNARHIIHGCFLRAGWSSGQGRRLCRGQCPDTASPGTLPGRSPAGCPHRSPPAM